VQHCGVRPWRERSRYIGVCLLLLVTACSHGGPAASRPTSADRTETTATSSTTRPCVASDLRGRGGRQGESGGAHGDIELTNTATTACGLVSLPSVTLRSGATELPLEQRPPSDLAPSSRLMRIEPSATAGLTLYWSNWCKPDPGPLQVEMTLPSGGGILIVPFNGPPNYDYVPRCDAPEQSSTLQIVG
jgi:hypothetical protein